MQITQINLHDIRCFEGRHTLSFSKKVNVFIGKNSSGKSSLLRALGFFQPANGAPQVGSFVRKGKPCGEMTLDFVNTDRRLPGHVIEAYKQEVRFGLVANGQPPTFQVRHHTAVHPQAGFSNLGQTSAISSFEPNNLFYPYFSKRKTQGFAETVNSNVTRHVSETLDNLYAKIARLANPENSLYSEFVTSCEKILGHRISVSASDHGSQAGLWVSQTEFIPLLDMGEGTGNILGLIVNLLVAERHIFLIEEVENDIHPEALKGLLELIAAKSENNQIFISTHSNIVLRHLGAVAEAKVFSFESRLLGRMFATKISEVETESARSSVLSALGYEPFDFGLWKGYLLLEESSAEAVINRILIPKFASKLMGRLRTISANGASKVEPAYSDFHRLFVFLHTSKIYPDNSWVRVDGDEPGLKVIAELTRKFPSQREHFLAYSKLVFEDYYPARFQAEAATAFSLEKEERIRAKRDLCQKVLAWADANPAEAKTEFAESASEIIGDLRKIERKLA